jgi:hypothetical protein
VAGVLEVPLVGGDCGIHDPKGAGRRVASGVATRVRRVAVRGG